MKLLLVFVSALVLVAQGNVTPFEEFAEEGPGVGVFGAEEEPIAERGPVLKNWAYIPCLGKACDVAACAYDCRQLGFTFGNCPSSSICWCFN